MNPDRRRGRLLPPIAAQSQRGLGGFRHANLDTRNGGHVVAVREGTVCCRTSERTGQTAMTTATNSASARGLPRRAGIHGKRIRSTPARQISIRIVRPTSRSAASNATAAIRTTWSTEGPKPRRTEIASASWSTETRGDFEDPRSSPVPGARPRCPTVNTHDRLLVARHPYHEQIPVRTLLTTPSRAVPGGRHAWLASRHCRANPRRRHTPR